MCNCFICAICSFTEGVEFCTGLIECLTLKVRIVCISLILTGDFFSDLQKRSGRLNRFVQRRSVLIFILHFTKIFHTLYSD